MKTEKDSFNSIAVENFIRHYRGAFETAMILMDQYLSGIISENEAKKLYDAVIRKEWNWRVDQIEQIESLGKRYPLAPVIREWYTTQRG